MIPTSAKVEGVPVFFSTYFDGHARGVSRLINRKFNATCSLIFSDPAGRFCVLEVTIRDKEFHLIGVYELNVTSEVPDFLQHIESFVTSGSFSGRLENYSQHLSRGREPNYPQIAKYFSRKNIQLR